MSGRKIRMWKSQKNEGRGRKEAWKLSSDLWGAATLDRRQMKQGSNREMSQDLVKRNQRKRKV